MFLKHLLHLSVVARRYINANHLTLTEYRSIIAAFFAPLPPRHARSTFTPHSDMGLVCEEYSRLCAHWSGVYAFRVCRCNSSGLQGAGTIQVLNTKQRASEIAASRLNWDVALCQKLRNADTTSLFLFRVQ